MNTTQLIYIGILIGSLLLFNFAYKKWQASKNKNASRRKGR